MVPSIICPELPSFYYICEDIKRDISDDFVITSEMLGKPGQFGRVFQCISNTDGEAYAVKIIKKCRFSDDETRAWAFKQFLSEIETMKDCKHPNIVKLHDVYENPDELFLVMELCGGGELYDKIAESNNEGGFSEKQAAIILRQILRAVCYMHEKDICHGDLKPANILFSTLQKDALVKIADFGYAKRVPRWRRYLKSMCGTALYMAPEVIEGRYMKEADLWSIGVIMFAMLFGYTPFQKSSDKQLNQWQKHRKIYKRIQQGFKGFSKIPRGEKISREAKNLIRHLLKNEVSRRYTAREALMHPWFEVADSKDEIPYDVLEQLTQANTLDNFQILVVSSSKGEVDLTIKEQLEKYFRKFDTNKDNKISLSEFVEGFKTYFPKEDNELVEEIFKHLDLDGDHFVQLDEFYKLFTYQHLISVYDRLREVFCGFDHNGDGYIDIADIEKLNTEMKKDPLVSRLEIDPISVIKSADLDRDDRVSFDEFLFKLHKDFVEPMLRNNMESQLATRSSDMEYKNDQNSTDPTAEWGRMDTLNVALSKLVKSPWTFNDDLSEVNQTKAISSPYNSEFQRNVCIYEKEIPKVDELVPEKRRNFARCWHGCSSRFNMASR